MKKNNKKKKWRGDLTETIGAYERLGLRSSYIMSYSRSPLITFKLPPCSTLFRKGVP